MYTTLLIPCRGYETLLKVFDSSRGSPEVLEKELAEVVEATAAANAEQEAAAAEWEDQRVRWAPTPRCDGTRGKHVCLCV